MRGGTALLCRRAAVAALLLAGAAWLATPGRAAAALGELAFDSCLSQPDGYGGCVDTALVSPRALAVSPDGGSVYVVSRDGDSITHLVRDRRDDRLVYDGCLASTAQLGCVDLPGGPLDAASGVAVSPDGTSVYVASYRSESISHFLRGTDGRLTYAGCMSPAEATCTELQYSPIAGATGVAVSPDGRSVFVTGSFVDSIAHFFRGVPGGQVALDGCLASTLTQGCGDLPGSPINKSAGVAVSPDGKSVYVASPASDSIAHFFRNGPDGQIGYDACLANTTADGCIDLSGAPLRGARGVAVSPDGRSVYVASPESNSVAHFFRDGPEGQLTYDGCLSSDDAPGCGDVPGTPLEGAAGVAVSPDGRSVYVASFFSDSISHFTRDPGDGRLAYGGCLARGNDAGQRCGEVPGRALDGALDVAVSPDGGSVYVASGAGQAVAHFVRALGDDPPRGSGTASQGTGPGTTGTTGAPGKVTCRGVRATIVGTGGRDRLRGTRRRDVIAALGGDDVVRGLAGNDLVCAGAGDDLVAGGPGRDTLTGGPGRDRLVGGPGTDRLLGGPQRDRCSGGPDRDRAAGCEARRSL